MLRIRLFRWEFPGGGFGFRPDWDSGSDQGRRGPVGLSCEDLRVYTCTTRPPGPHLAKGLGQCTPAHPSRQCGPRIGWVGPVFQGVDNAAHPNLHWDGQREGLHASRIWVWLSFRIDCNLVSQAFWAACMAESWRRPPLKEAYPL